MDKKQIIPIGCDHAGYKLKENVKKYFIDKGYSFQDFGCNSEQSIDYPDYAHPVANVIEENKETLGVLICGSGNGINMSANKHQGVRSALSWKKEIASLAREHNDANIIAIPARFVSEEEAIEMIEVFLTTEFEGGRHQRRVDKIACS